MGPIQKFGIKVEILAGGPEASRVATRLNALGMVMVPVATDYGRASATKLCRSIMIKGIEALMVDCARASAHWGVEEPVYASLARTFPGNDWTALSVDMAERVATHGVRRAAEMREAADMVREMGLDPALASAVAAAQLKGAKPKT
jgi:3-hydroxyisobutyrate dehydrogenase-like beta-hydroxyacid dehydrogenase